MNSLTRLALGGLTRAIGLHRQFDRASAAHCDSQLFLREFAKNRMGNKIIELYSKHRPEVICPQEQQPVVDSHGKIGKGSIEIESE